MAEQERHAKPETTGSPVESVEHRVPLYPITVESKRHEDGTREEADEQGEAKKERSHSQLQLADTQTDRKVEITVDNASDTGCNQRVYKKSSPNNKLTLYLASRDLIVSESKIDKLQGVILVDPDYLQDKKVYGQITLTFRYGREDEEVMGLKLGNEAVMCLAQLYPPYSGADHQETTPLQEALVKRLGPNAHAFTMEITPLAPPSVQLVPAMEYNGAPIGTSYDVRAYVTERKDEKLHRKTTVRMSIRVMQRITRPRVTFTENEITEDKENEGPHAAVEKPFILSDGRIGLEARLDRAFYAHGDSITVHVNVNNNSSKSVRRIEVLIVQHVDVCMFSNGKFKNVVAMLLSKEGCPIGPGSSINRSYTLRPIKGSTKNWIAMEDSYTKAGTTLASTVVCPGNGPDDRNVFAIYVSYYVKVKLLVSGMGGEVSLKLPFTLMRSNTDPDLVGFPSPIREPTKLSPNYGKANEITGNAEKQDDIEHRYKASKLEPIKEKTKESKDLDVDLIEHYEEADST